MKSMLSNAIDELVEEVLCNGDAIIKLDGTVDSTQLAGCWEADVDGNSVIGIYLYVAGKQVFTLQDVGTKTVNNLTR